jgi:hypothetical protein
MHGCCLVAPRASSLSLTLYSLAGRRSLKRAARRRRARELDREGSACESGRTRAGAGEHGRLKKKQWCVRTYVHGRLRACGRRRGHIMHACRSTEDRSMHMERLLFACILCLGPPELRGREYVAMFYDLSFEKNCYVFFKENCYLCVKMVSKRPWPGIMLRTVFFYLSKGSRCRPHTQDTLLNHKLSI